jgi:hypothetical protein
MESITLDVWNIIANLHNDINVLVALKSCCKFLNRLLIINLNDGLKKLNNNIVSRPDFSNVVKLNVDNNKNITSVSNMKRLRVLNASGYCGIDQDGKPNPGLATAYAKRAACHLGTRPE